ncbi:WXG100 family type VII secretion target [Amycolatopsis cynarae]|uniref:WXG100 family type VII secretion target n=1 Tax=Amycolatopsis cynarae TaxID=2995223 RepID=A0ABY7B2J4_9PSEU|nr:WXG100 family type VII secretion target [Amycolatopsis sp. HUAS 11-8]WAL66525.1 WXG100 family type VII secretion target [Amycolatopsis sp. HUAS 11-8]
MAATDPAPPIFDPELEKLTFDQIAQLINELPPELFYQQARLFDAAAARMETVLGDFRRESRQMHEYWGGQVSEAFDEVAQGLAARITNILQPMLVPGYGQALRQAGDALALAQQRLRDLRAQQAAAPPPVTPPAPGTPTPEQIGHDYALQILRDLGTAYHDIGLGIAPMPELDGRTGPTGDNGSGTGPGQSGTANQVVETIPVLSDSGTTGYPVPAGFFGTSGYPGGSTEGAWAAGDVAGTRRFASSGEAYPPGYVLGETTRYDVVTCAPETTSEAGTRSAFALSSGLEGAVVPAVLGRGADEIPVAQPRVRTTKTAVSTKNTKSTKKAALAAEGTTEGTAGEPAATDRPMTVSEIATENAATPAAPPVTVSRTAAVATPHPATTAATTATTAAAAHAGPTPATATARITATANATLPQSPALPQTSATPQGLDAPQVPTGSGHQVAVNTAASAASTVERSLQMSGPGGAATGGYRAPLPGGVAQNGPAPVRPLAADLAAASEAGFPMTGGASGTAVVPGAASAGAGTGPVSPMMFGGMQAQQKEKDRMAAVPIGPGPDVWDGADDMPSVLGRPEPRPEAPAAEPPGSGSKIEDLRQLGDEVLGRIRGRRRQG